MYKKKQTYDYLKSGQERDAKKNSVRFSVQTWSLRLAGTAPWKSANPRQDRDVRSRRVYAYDTSQSHDTRLIKKKKKNVNT